MDQTIAKEILRLRLSQMLVNERYKAGAFKIPIHLAMGHEAIAIAVDQAMGTEDLLACSHRNMHYNLAREKSLKPILDEYLLKKEGLAHGELGSMNLANPKKKLIYSSSILGNNLAVASGLALAQKAKGGKGLVIVETGDGAAEEGAFYESLLFMKSNALPAIVIIENNEWSMHTRIEERRSEIDFSKLANSLGASYATLRGNDAYEYAVQLKEIRAQAFAEKSPVVIEVRIMTLGGWYVKNDDGKGDRYVHLHAGPTKAISLAEWPEIESSANDPVFVLQKHFPAEILKTMAKEILKNLEAEIA